jgi:hypothetical protein
MERALGDAWVEHVREAWVWMRDGWIPYPFQNNIWRLPAVERDACVMGLQALQHSTAAAPPTTFREWLLRSFGEGESAKRFYSHTTAKYGLTIRRR